MSLCDVVAYKGWLLLCSYSYILFLIRLITGVRSGGEIAFSSEFVVDVEWKARVSWENRKRNTTDEFEGMIGIEMPQKQNKCENIKLMFESQYSS